MAKMDLSRDLSKKLLSKILVCPMCGEKFDISSDCHSIICRGERHHCYDGGGNGYVSMSRSGGGGDSKEAVQARSRFLTKGYYAPAANALLSCVKKHVAPQGCIIDAGCGEGYYSDIIASNGYSVLGVDLSKFAVDTAARRGKMRCMESGSESSTLYATSSVYELPVLSDSADAVINVFAPCVPEEYARVLRDGGALIVAAAGERHLLGLKKVMYDDPYLNDIRHDLPSADSCLEFVEKITAAFDMTVNGSEDIAALFSMTPYYWRTANADKEKLNKVNELFTGVEFDFFVYKKKM